MYAMLTGTLPFTVEPFSLRALYQKMVDKEMNPFPTQLSTGNQKSAFRLTQIQLVGTIALNLGLHVVLPAWYANHEKWSF